jgi:hypothetical protein
MSDDFESELHDRLAARADAVPVTDDWDDLLERSARRDRRTIRVLSLSLVVVLCAAGAGIVVAARGNDHAPAKKAATPPPAASVVPTHARVPTIGAAAFGAGGSAGSNGLTIGQVLTRGVPENQPMAKIFTRTTSAGVVIRAYQANVQSTAGGPPWWTPPAWCFPSAYVQADVSDSAIAAVASGALYAEQRDGAKISGTIDIVGQSERAVRWVVIAQGPSDVAQIRATFPDGSTDEMAPVDGVAVLIGSGAANPQLAVGVDAIAADGSVIATASLDGSSYSFAQRVGEGLEKACVSPTALPAPGHDQPADAAAARQQVTDVFNAAYRKGNTDAQFASYFDDARGFAEIQKQMRAGPYAAEIAAAQTKLDDLVFLDATTAAIQYEWSIPSSPGSGFTNRFTEAHLVNGEWKLSRVGRCNDVALAGFTCPT